MICISFPCCLTNYCKRISIKTTHISFLKVSVGQEPGHRLCKAAITVVARTGFLLSSLMWDKLAFKFTQVVAEMTSLKV